MRIPQELISNIYQLVDVDTDIKAIYNKCMKQLLCITKNTKIKYDVNYSYPKPVM